jgi:hypothetical protein
VTAFARELLRRRRGQLVQQAYVTLQRDAAGVDNRLERLVVETQGQVPRQQIETPAAAAPAPAAE